MCFYRQLHFNCEHRIQWECFELCITAMNSPEPDLCQVHLPVGEVFSDHGFVCKYCSIDLAASVGVQRPPNGDNDKFGRGEPHHPLIDPRLVNTSGSSGGGGGGGGGRQYHPQIMGVNMNQDEGGFWDEEGGDRQGAASYNMAQGYENIGSRHDGPLKDSIIHNQYGYQMMGGAVEHLTTNSYPNIPPPQARPNHQHRYPSIQSEKKSKNHPMPYPYLPPKKISPQRRLNTKRYELALQGPQRASLEHHRTDASFSKSPAATPPNLRYRELVNLLGDPTTPTKNSTQSMNWIDPLPDGSPKNAQCLNKHEVPYFNYSQDYFDRREAGLESRGIQQLAIIDTLSRVRGSDSPALGFDESKDLYEETLAPEARRYRSDMPHFQARSKVLLKALKNGKDLGDVQFWLRTAEKLKETEGRVAEPLREMEGWMGAVNQNAFPSWDRHPRRGWCGWVAEAEGHLEGGHGYAGTYVDENGDVPM